MLLSTTLYSRYRSSSVMCCAVLCCAVFHNCTIRGYVTRACVSGYAAIFHSYTPTKGITSPTKFFSITFGSFSRIRWDRTLKVADYQKSFLLQSMFFFSRIWLGFIFVRFFLLFGISDFGAFTKNIPLSALYSLSHNAQLLTHSSLQAQIHDK